MGNNTKKIMPENIVLLGSYDTQTSYVHSIVAEEKTHHPEKFEGNRDCFDFELRYTAPFDKNFCELKRLQGTAAEAAGRRAEFKGYIVINMNEWITHHEDDYLNKALLFLVDMNACWKYIFLISDLNMKAARELTGKILEIFFLNHIVCKVKECSSGSSVKNLTSTVCKELGVTCAPPVKETIEEMFILGFDQSIVSALLSEVSWYEGKKISMDAFCGYISDHEPSVSYMLSQKEYCRLMSIIEHRKENWYDEKEAV